MCWIPSHIGVRGNERADSVAKAALDLRPDNIHIPYTDLKSKINKLFFAKWQQRWNNNISNKLFQIKPTLGEWRPAFRKSRKEQVIRSRVRIGHTKRTHSYLLKQEQPPQCSTCHSRGMWSFANARKQYFKNSNMKKYIWECPHGWRSLFLEKDRVILKNITPGHNSESTYQTTKIKCYWYIAIL